ncbi:ATP-binding cassette domain-containing protein [Microlunatus speluncae]|uniref:ATP-binding cassette domain-containing protein n=1 Tax=Microlunatus speluncae TaxID=2594267 RepID=UPI0012664B1B|nr:ABC transporter ATP-binding protein [Microlunatus speluncae]
MTADDDVPSDTESLRARLWGSVSRTVIYVRLLWAAGPGWAAAALLLTVASAATSTVLLVAIGELANALVAAVGQGAGSVAAQGMWWRLGLVGGLLLLGPALGAALGWVTEVVTARYIVHVQTLVAETGVRPPGLTELDSPGFSGRLESVVAATRDWTFWFGTQSTWSVLSVRLGGVGALVILLSWRWWVGLLVVGAFVIVSRSFTRWIESSFDQVLTTGSADMRRAKYARGLLVEPPAAKEVRIFGLTDWLVERYRSHWFAAMTELWPKRRVGLRPVYLACLAMAVVIGGALALLVWDVSTGAVGVGGVVTIVPAILALEAFGILGDQQTSLTQNMTTAAAAARLRERVGLPPTRPAPELGAARSTLTAPAEVDLEAVSFSYPTRDQPALSAVSLHIPAGQSVAIVGVNGAGKSTIVKLLCGLYEPDRGRVRIGGLDPADPGAAGRVAAIFQDFVHYELPLRDNVVLRASATEPTENHEQVRARALRRAGGDAVLQTLPDGWDTILSPEYEGGTELSGGQWQRVALARALAAVEQGAGLLILDEPTAALDVRAEVALFDTVLDVGRSVTTILVSHRLSGARRADRIVVLDPERGIVEDGSHDELIRAGGEYATMFTLQASRFTTPDGAGDQE